MHFHDVLFIRTQYHNVYDTTKDTLNFYHRPSDETYIKNGGIQTFLLLTFLQIERL